MATDTPAEDGPAPPHRRGRAADLVAWLRGAAARGYRRARRAANSADVRWCALGLLAGIAVVGTYLATHRYPAYGGGLYLEIAAQIRAHGYALPARIPGYTAGGVPFAYPPLGFYLAAVVRDLTGVGPTTYALVVPGLLVVASLVPYYLVARELLGSARLAGLASVLFASTPAALQWHLSAGGMVRALALGFVLAGTYAGLRLFARGEPRWLVPATVMFGLTVLTHPVYTVFYGLTYLLLVARFAPTVRGVLAGAVVAAGGLALAAPWWLQVIAHHGVGIFTAAAGTHSGLGGGSGRLLSAFVFPLYPNLEKVFYLGAYPGALYALSRREWFLPAWLAVPGYLIGKPRFQFVAGSILTALLLGEIVLPRLADALPTVPSLPSSPSSDHTLRTALLAVVVLGSVGVGAAYTGSALQTHDDSTSQPAFVDEADRTAMAWAARSTAGERTFVVLGDAAEWFPLYTDRTILVGPWGVEWTTPARYAHQLSLFKSVSACEDAACVTNTLEGAGVSPDYVYVPKGEYTVRGHEHVQDPGMRDSMVAADRYDLVYENEGVLIFRVVDGEVEEGPHRTALDRQRGAKSPGARNPSR